MKNLIIVVLTILLALSVGSLIYIYTKNNSAELDTTLKSEVDRSSIISAQNTSQNSEKNTTTPKKNSNPNDSEDTLITKNDDDIQLNDKLIKLTRKVASEIDGKDLLAENERIVRMFKSQEGISDWGNRIESQVNSKLNEPQVYNHLAEKKLLYVNTTCKQTVCRMTFSSTIPQTDDLDSQLSITTTKTAHIIKTMADNGLLTELSSELNTELDNNNNQFNVFMTQN